MQGDTNFTDILRVVNTFKTPNLDVVVHSAGHKLIAIHRMEVLYRAVSQS